MKFNLQKYQIILYMRTYNANSQQRSAKGSNLKEDDGALLYAVLPQGGRQWSP